MVYLATGSLARSRGRPALPRTETWFKIQPRAVRETKPFREFHSVAGATRPAASCARRGSAALNQQGFEAVEARVPEGALGADPGRDRIEWRRVERHAMFPPADGAADESRAFQDLDVLRDRVERHVERRREIRDPRRAGHERVEDGAASRICERQQCVVETGIVEGTHGNIIQP